MTIQNHYIKLLASSIARHGVIVAALLLFFFEKGRTFMGLSTDSAPCNSRLLLKKSAGRHMPCTTVPSVVNLPCTAIVHKDEVGEK